MNRLLIPAATLFVIGTNAAATLLPINGMATGELSALSPTGFTPAGWVFSIWSVIYLGLILFSVRAARLSTRTAGAAAVARLASIELPYLASCAANIAWIFLWHYRQVGASVVAMLALLAALVVVYRRLRRQPASSTWERVVVDGTFSLYIGWITTATLANFGAWFFALGAYPFGLTMDEAAIVTVVLATAVYVALGTWTADPLYTAVFVWASIGIIYGTAAITSPVRLAAAAGCAAAALVTALSIARRVSSRPAAA